MKIKILLLFNLLLFFNSLNSQTNGKVIYKISVENTVDTSKDSKYKFINSLEDVAKKFELKLLFNNGKSFYELIKPMKMDGREESIFKMAQIVFKAKNKFITSLKEKKITTQKDFGGEIYLIEKKLDISDWKLINEEKKIGGYVCYKAERVYFYNSRKGKSSVNQVVWYSPEISLSYGPAEFCGFPGLVLSAKSGNIVYTAKIINLYNNKIESIEPLKGKKVSDEEFKKIAKKARENLMRN
jgi:GLPGLI family protein